MAETIRVMRLAVGKPPEVVDIPAGLESLQKEVGGYIEVVGIRNGIDAYVNEEGFLIGLPFNRVIPTTFGGGRLVPVAGNVVVAGHNDEGDTVSLTNEQVAELFIVFRVTDAIRPQRPLAEA